MPRARGPEPSGGAPTGDVRGGGGAVVVIGGGLAGVQAALDLATAGARVHLVEASASLGGHMAALDKTFPTNDCAMCILSPLLVEAARHPNVTVHTLSRVTSLEGGAGAFRVRIATEPRYVDAAKCTACGLCSQKCPVRVRSEFERGLAERAAIYTPFPQAVPSTYRIDPAACRYLTEGKCGVCAKVCPPRAVHYTMRPEVLEVDAGAVVVATGASEYDPGPLVELGWGRSSDVITALQLERLLSASGPTGGRLVRPSDGAAPRRIAWVHCAGSRDVHRVPYCSRVCCMYSAKQAVVAAEHAAAEGALERLDLFHIDLRAQGKGFHEYVERAATGRLHLVRARVAEVAPDGKGRLAVLHDDPHGGGPREDAYDLVVLAVPLVARPDARRLAGVLGVDCDRHGFVVESDPIARPGETSRPGVLVAGMASGPRDVTDTVLGASARSYTDEDVAPECDYVYTLVVHLPAGYGTTIRSQPLAVTTAALPAITDFTAVPAAGGVRLDWKVDSQDIVEGFRAHRTCAGFPDVWIPADTLLSPDTRTVTDTNVTAGLVYQYRLTMYLTKDRETLSPAWVQVSFVRAEPVPSVFSLGQNQPNPFTPTTSIPYGLPERAWVTLDIFDIKGRRICTLVNESQERGFKSVPWDGRDGAGAAVPSGVYFYRLHAGSSTETRKMVLVR